jgi:hypothetical protein
LGRRSFHKPIWPSRRTKSMRQASRWSSTTKRHYKRKSIKLMSIRICRISHSLKKLNRVPTRWRNQGPCHDREFQ